MSNETKLVGVIGLLAGIIIGILGVNFTSINGMNNMMRNMNSLNREEIEYMPMMQHHSASSMEDTMEAMTHSLEGKEGTEFDEAFLRSMIVHHRGAIDMARDAQLYSEREEIKEMSEKIINVQQTEIELMEQWLKEWGY